MPDRPQFCMSSRSKVTVRPYHDDDGSHLSNDERERDTWFQDVMTHADKWIGGVSMLCGITMGSTIFISWLVLGSPSSVQDLIASAASNFAMAIGDPRANEVGLYVGRMVSAVLFGVGLIGALCLVWYGMLFGQVYATNKGRGFRSILDPISDVVLKNKALPSGETPFGAELGERSIGVMFFWYASFFVAEMILIILGVYIAILWVQIILGAIATILSIFALLRNINKSALRQVELAELTAAAANKIDRDDKKAKILRDPLAAAKQKKKLAELADKHQAMMIMTIVDFFLAISHGVACVLLLGDGHGLWVDVLASFTFLATGFWMTILGHTTGYGNPGHHPDEPNDHAVRAEPRSSVTQLLLEARKRREEGL